MQPQVSAIGILIPLLLLLISGFFLFQKYSGLSRGKAFLVLLASIIPGALYLVRSVPRPNDGAAPVIFAKIACIVFLTAFVLRLWGRWVGEKATAEEHQPGLPGVRAWFSTANVLVGLILVLTLWYGFDFPPLLIAVVIAAALAAYPLLRMESTAIAPAPVPDDLSAEREKILAMLEAGKLTPDESAELLQALRETSRTPARQVPLTSGQRLMLIGAALVGLGFFLPWLVINPGKEAGRMMNQMQSSVTSSFGGTVNFPGGMTFPGMELTTSSVSIGGGDIPRGLGWAALAFALTAALLPYIATTLDAATARTIRLLCLSVGGFIVIYVLTQNLRFTGIGLVMAVGGYVLEAAGALREHRVASDPA